jgi:two-component system, NarL family, sensor kinase
VSSKRFVPREGLRGRALPSALRPPTQPVVRAVGKFALTGIAALGLLSSKPSAIAAVDRLVRRRVLRDPVVRVKIWNGRGRVLYSDAHRLIGTSYSLKPDELAALRSRSADAEVSDLTKPENRFERSYPKLLEVYLGIRGPAPSEPARCRRRS